MANREQFSDEKRKWAAHFGVAPAAIDHDRLISHMLVGLSSWDQETIFYGGTALSRTHLSGFRLSEDIDVQIDSPAAHVDGLG